MTPERIVDRVFGPRWTRECSETVATPAGLRTIHVSFGRVSLVLVKLTTAALLVVLSVLLFACRANAEMRQGGLHLPAATQKYLDRLASLPPPHGPVAVESLFVLAASAADALTLPQESGGPNAVESMNDSAAALARRFLPGISIIHWDELNGAVPDDSFFLDLSQRFGTRADVEFFRLRMATTDKWGTPIWTERTYDYGGCTKFGSGEIVGAWAAWSTYAKRFPGRYALVVRDALDVCRQELLEGECVCGEQEDLLRELRLFIQRIPEDQLVSTVRARIETIERATAPIRYHCRPS